MVGHLQPEAQHVDALALRIEQRDGVAVVVHRKPGVQPGRLHGVIHPDHEITVGLDYCASGEVKLSGLGRVVAQAPVLQVHISAGDVLQLDKVGERGAVWHRADILGEHLVEDDQRLRAAGAGLAGRAALGQAGAPVGRRVGIAVGVAQYERVAVAVRRAWPSAVVVVVHRQHGLAIAIEQGQTLALVRQAALVKAIQPHAGMARPECRDIGIVDEQQVHPGIK